MAAARINGRELSKMPVDKVDEAAVIDWLDGFTVRHGLQS